MEQIEVQEAVEKITEKQFKKMFDFDDETGILLRKPTKRLNDLDNWRNKQNSKVDKLLELVIQEQK